VDGVEAGWGEVGGGRGVARLEARTGDVGAVGRGDLDHLAPADTEHAADFVGAGVEDDSILPEVFLNLHERLGHGGRAVGLEIHARHPGSFIPVSDGERLTKRETQRRTNDGS
jgi:hypothetical protein